MSKKNGNHKGNYPGRPKRCDIIPGSTACRKCQKNNGMLCKNCKSPEARGVVKV